MKIVNKSRKIISIGGMALLPGKTMELPKGVEKHPSILDYLKKGVVADVNAVTTSFVSADISDEEKTKIAEEAIAKYKDDAFFRYCQAVKVVSALDENLSGIVIPKELTDAIAENFGARKDGVTDTKKLLQIFEDMQKGSVNGVDLSEFVTYNWSAIIIGTIVSAIVGYLCIKYFLKFVGKYSLAFFGYYCIIVGVATFVFFNIVK